MIKHLFPLCALFSTTELGFEMVHGKVVRV